MYRPSQTPRLDVSSERITRERGIVTRASRDPARTVLPPLARLAQKTVTLDLADGARSPPNRVSNETMKVVVFHC